MKKELLERVAELINSGQREMENLGRALFWGSNPSIEDYNTLHKMRGGRHNVYEDEGHFEDVKRDCIKRMCGQETYESIYGKKSSGKSKENVGF